MPGQWQVRAALLTAANETHTNLSPEVDPVAVELYTGNLLSLLTEMNAGNGTRHFIRPADDRDDWYAYTTYNRNDKFNGTADATIDDALSIDGWQVTGDTVLNQQKATIDWPDFPPATIKVWDYDGVPPLPLVIKAGNPLVLTAAYSDYVLSCPSLLLESSGDDLTVTLINQGWDAVITLTSEGTSTITMFSLYGMEAVREPEQTYTAENADSQAFPRGVRAGPDIAGDMVGVMASARGIAQHLIFRYSGMPVGEELVPMKRPSLTVVNWLPDALERDLYDIVAVNSVQLRADGILFEIVGLNEQVNRAPNTGDVYIVTTYQLQEARLQTPFTWFTLDVSALDEDSEPGDILGFEGVAGDEVVHLSWSVSSGGTTAPLAY